MSEITTKKLRKEIHEILKDADLTQMSSKKVRLQLSKTLETDLTSRKEEIDRLVMEFVDSRNADSNEESENESSGDEKPKAKPAKKGAATKRKASSEEEGSEPESGGDDSDDGKKKRNKAPPPAKRGKGRGKKGSEESGSDGDWKKPAVPKKSAAGKGKGNGITRSLTLSPELAAIMGEPSLPRHAVVKKIWAIIKERNLYDPKNKQYAICDAELLTVIGVKRFRTFGMLKHLKEHFLD